MDEKIRSRQTFIINTAYFALVAALFYLAARFLVPWLLPLILGYVIAILLGPAVRFLRRRAGLGPKLSGAVVVILAYALIGLLLTWGGLLALTQIGRLFAGLPYFYENTIEPGIRAISLYFSNAFGDYIPGLGDEDALAITLQDFQSALLAISTGVLGFLGALGANIPGFLLAFFFTIMSSLIISMNYGQVTGFLSRQIPEKYRSLISRVRSDAQRTLGNYFVAYLKIMCVTFVELAVGLTILGVSGAPLIALGIAVFDFFPVLGTGGIMIPWIVLEILRGDFTLAIGLGVLYAIVSVVRGFIEPKIVGGQLGQHPLVTLCAIYAGFRVMGLMGMVFFPILAQILVGLHRSGVLRLWKN
ncbi:MAG: sporulation integral membrane protein YtvI [Oscillospiraceae bacterium]|nr:sporulation integral membrane protein YtvI [Oscillospiraceae bacterium]